MIRYGLGGLIAFLLIDVANAQSLSRDAELEVLAWSCSKEHGFVFVRGEVKNVSQSSIRHVVAVATYRTSDGTFVKSSEALIDFDPIMSNQTSPFETGTRDNPAIRSCNIRFKELLGRELRVVDARAQRDEQRQTIRDIQKSLNELGYDAGVADGILGPKTRAAIVKFQRDQGMRADGAASEAVRLRLRSEIIRR